MTFQAEIREHLRRWARDEGLGERELEVRSGKTSLVLRRDHERKNVFKAPWWDWLRGKEHRWARALNSSQSFAVNLFGPLVEDASLATAVARALLGADRVPPGASVTCRLEFTPRPTRELLGEAGQPTQVDAAFEVTTPDGGAGYWFIEVKLGETEFGTCRGGRQTGGANPAPNRCLELATVLDSPGTRCWLAETERRRYWDWIAAPGSSFDMRRLRLERACPFRLGLYQLMRNRALADALVASGEVGWALVATCIHPSNVSVRRLRSEVADHDDVLDAFATLTKAGSFGRLDPGKVLDATVAASPSSRDWANWVRAKYALTDSSAAA